MFQWFIDACAPVIRSTLPWPLECDMCAEKAGFDDSSTLRINTRHPLAEYYKLRN